MGTHDFVHGLNTCVDSAPGMHIMMTITSNTVASNDGVIPTSPLSDGLNGPSHTVIGGLMDPEGPIILPCCTLQHEDVTLPRNSGSHRSQRTSFLSDPPHNWESAHWQNNNGRHIDVDDFDVDVSRGVLSSLSSFISHAAFLPSCMILLAAPICRTPLFLPSPK